jgi:hypothetical protein
MEKTNSDAELDALIAELTGLTANSGEDAEYPLPESKPVKYTNVDVVVMPHGYKYPKPSEESISMDSLPLQLDLDSLSEVDGLLSVPATAVGRCATLARGACSVRTRVRARHSQA